MCPKGHIDVDASEYRPVGHRLSFPTIAAAPAKRPLALITKLILLWLRAASFRRRGVRTSLDEPTGAAISRRVADVHVQVPWG